jgi:general L-amino acid transport system substrate-binding protein
MHQPRLWLAALFLATALPLGPARSALADTLADVKQRGVLRCGVSGELPGLSFRAPDGTWSGLDVDFCRAVAAAVLGHQDQLELVPVPTASDRFELLRAGKFDLLSRNTTWTLSRDADGAIAFPATLYYDGQGFMVRRDTSTLSARELSRKTICAVQDTTGPINVRDYFARNRMELDLKLYPDVKAATQAYTDGTCYALTTDQSELHALRAALGSDSVHRILPEVISKEPLAPVVRGGDERWFDIVRWTLFTLINAEEAGIDSANADQVRARAQAAETRLLLDLDGETGKMLGLDKGWGYRIIAQVGNYAQVFERNLGAGSALHMPRGINALWRDGGILYAPPVR